MSDLTTNALEKLGEATFRIEQLERDLAAARAELLKAERAVTSARDEKVDSLALGVDAVREAFAAADHWRKVARVAINEISKMTCMNMRPMTIDEVEAWAEAEVKKGGTP